jgi:hypothetical protein
VCKVLVLWDLLAQDANFGFPGDRAIVVVQQPVETIERVLGEGGVQRRACGPGALCCAPVAVGRHSHYSVRLCRRHIDKQASSADAECRVGIRQAGSDNMHALTAGCT